MYDFIGYETQSPHTNTIEPQDASSSRRAVPPCSRDASDTAPDPTSAPRAPGAGKHPACAPARARDRDDLSRSSRDPDSASADQAL